MFLFGAWTVDAKSQIEGVKDGNGGDNPDLKLPKRCDFAQCQQHRFHPTIDGILKPTTTLVWHVYERLLTPCDSQVLRIQQFPHALRDGKSSGEPDVHDTAPITMTKVRHQKITRMFNKPKSHAWVPATIQYLLKKPMPSPHAHWIPSPFYASIPTRQPPICLLFLLQILVSKHQ